ncbi:MAG: nucleotidyltransferase domain-containing protein [Nanoarchaeota archaeon]
MDGKTPENEERSVEQNLAEDYIPKEKLGDLPISNNIPKELKEEMEKTRKDIDKFKEELSKKFKFIEGLGIIPAQAAQKLEEEYEVPEEEAKKKLIHILIVVPEDKFKEMGKFKMEAISIAKNINEKFWIHTLTPIDLWNLCLDSKFDIVEAFAMCFPVIDKGILGALRVAEIHKTLVLRKFEKYVTTYVIAGSLIRGEAKSTSDVDVFIVIDDTDVKRMSRLELKEKIRSIVYSFIQEATAIAGVKNILNVQVYLLTEFWDSVKDAHPVMFTFIRDGVPLYDRGAFLPWKSLLKMGKIRPSPEAIDMFMSAGDKLEEAINRRLIDIVVYDIYWGVLTSTQGLLMLYGLAPPTPKETVKLVRETLCEKEKILEKRYVDIFEKIITYYKDYEHGKIKESSGSEIDKFTKDSLDYMKRLKELRLQIEKRVQKKSIEEIYKEVFDMLEALLRKNSEKALIDEFEDKLVKTGRFPQRFLDGLKLIARTKLEFEKPEKEEKKKKSDKEKEMSGKEVRDVEKARRYASEIVTALIEYTQRCDFLSMDRARFILKTKDGSSEVFFLNDVFVVQRNKILKLKNNQLMDSNTEELKDQLLVHKEKETKIDFRALDSLKKILGEFELIY